MEIKQSLQNINLSQNLLYPKPSKRWFRVEITAWEGELMPEGALTSFTICDTHRYLRVGHS